VHVVGVHAEDGGDARAGLVRLLRAGPHGGFATRDLDDGAGGSHGGVAVERMLIFALDDAGSGGKRRIDRALVHRLGRAEIVARILRHGRRLADVVVERLHVGEGRLRIRPFDLDRLGRLHRVPLVVGDHGEQVVHLHHLGAGNGLDRGFVDRRRRRAGDGWADHPRMQHVRPTDLRDIAGLGEHLALDLAAENRRSDVLVLRDRLRLRLAFDVQRVAVFLVPGQRAVEILAADQLPVPDRLAGALHHAVLDGQRLGRDAEPLGRHRDQQAARLGGGVADRHGAFLEPGRAAAAALVDGERGVAHDDSDAIDVDVHLVGDDLGDGGVERLAHVHLAEEHANAAVGMDRDEGVERGRQQRRLAGGKRLGRGAAHRG
jgi:hypothetical protein